jgi:IPT/TIG domain
MRRFLSLLFLPALMATALAQQRSASITSIAPTFGPPGTTVSIRGKGFTGFEPGSPWVKDLATEPPPGFVEFNGVPGDVLFWEDDLITVKVPRHATSGAIRIVLADTRTVLSGDAFDVYYATIDQNGRSTQRNYSSGSNIEGQNGSRERLPFFDEQVPTQPLYFNPWFSSLAPGQRTFLAENGFLFGDPFLLDRVGSSFFGGSSFSRGRQGFGFDLFGFDPFFSGVFFRGSHNFGVRPFGFSFHHFSSFHNEGRNQGHIFRR